jgi:hypothetical protein
MSERHLLVGVFSGIEAVLEAGRLVKGKGFQVIEIFSPFPSDEIEKAIGEENSPIRYFTLLGGLLGFTGGFALTVGVALRHGIVTGGKPVIAIPPRRTLYDARFLVESEIKAKNSRRILLQGLHGGSIRIGVSLRRR